VTISPKIGLARQIKSPGAAKCTPYGGTIAWPGQFGSALGENGRARKCRVRARLFGFLEQIG
jgi:hypothetical protein